MAGMNFGCLFDPGGCVQAAVSSWVDWVPFGIIGVTFAAGLICGAILGKWGVGAVIALGLALKVSGKAVPTEAQYPHPDRPEDRPVPKKRRKGETAADRWEK